MANEQDTGRGATPENASMQANEQASSGGRSEQNARQRNNEQAKEGHGEGEEKIRPPTHNVKSEPRWDPSDGPAGGGAKRT